jgi:transposase
MGSSVAVPLRRAIVRLFFDEGRSYEEIASVLEVGEATVSRVLRRYRETGSVEPAAPGGGNFSPITKTVAELLQHFVAQLPDRTVAELTAALVEHTGVSTSWSAVQRALARLGYSQKKRPSSPRSATPPSTGRGAGRTARSSPR